MTLALALAQRNHSHHDLNERMRRGQGNLEHKTSGPESGKWETLIRQEPGNWEKTPGRTAGFPDWPGVSDIQQPSQSGASIMKAE